MKLAWKMILATVLIVAMAVSFCGYFILRAGFRSELDAQFSSAARESQLFCLALDDRELSSLGERGGYFQNFDYCILNGEGETVAASGIRLTRLSPAQAREDRAVSRIFQDAGGNYHIETLQMIRMEDGEYYVCLFRDVSRVFEARHRNLRTWQLAMTIAVACSAAVTVAVAMLLTAPIQRLSRTTCQMAEGQYSRRAKVSSHDELGRLAQDFNRMADALETQISRLEAAAQRQRDFTASFAHELKTPLTSVIGYADTLRSRELPPDMQMRAASYIFSEGKRLENLSFALLDLFALEKEMPELRPLSMRTVATAAAESIRYLLRQSGMQLKVDVEDATIPGEPSLLEALLFNLLDNARKASEVHGVLELLGRRERHGYAFQVRDYGRGIPPDALEHLTEAFYMVDKSRARAEGGAGLGLALCERIVQVHGGTMEFESAVGQGTTVTVRIGGSHE